MEDIERIKERLDNIQGVEPIITSLRTIAAGGWRLALKRVRASQQYVDNLAGALGDLLYHLPMKKLAHPLVCHEPPVPRRAMVLVMASERGLCGAFNDTVLAAAERLIAQQQLQSSQVLISTLGGRAEAYFRAQGRDPFITHPLPVTHVASFEMVRDLGQTLIDSLYSSEIDAIYVIYSPYKAATTAPPVSERWLPIDASLLPTHSGQGTEPIIETDARQLFGRIIEEWIFVRLFQFVMESAASEQSARFRAMDAASTNLSRIIEELTLSYHSARQHAITMEMLDLVAGSGILRGPHGRRGH